MTLFGLSTAEKQRQAHNRAQANAILMLHEAARGLDQGALAKELRILVHQLEHEDLKLLQKKINELVWPNI